MWKGSIIFLLCIGMAMSEKSPYGPRGWRPSGQYFNPANNRLHAHYGPPGFETYEPPDTTTYQPQLITTTTARPTTLATRKTTTPRSREPTTPPTVPEEDFDTNPVLAIANSFAFNRPVYIYNSFPFLPGHVLVK